jgi:3-deoxy-manno-octulosonate cytidylyltransferase (CMP-KDO synthetase)
MSKLIGIIPARYGSKRFPGKSIALLAGKPVIVHVYESARRFKQWEDLVVATDDARIANVCSEHGITSVMTKSTHLDCIDRAYETMEILRNKGKVADRYVIVQGDEPFFDASILEIDYSPEIINFYTKIIDESELYDSNVVKVVVSKDLRAIYFSRHLIPYCNAQTQKSKDLLSFDKQIGIYAFSPEALTKFCTSGMSFLEGMEGIGLLRCLENDMPVHMRYAQYDSLSIDTPQDLAKAEMKIRTNIPEKHEQDLLLH